MVNSLCACALGRPELAHVRWAHITGRGGCRRLPLEEQARRKSSTQSRIWLQCYLGKCRGEAIALCLIQSLCTQAELFSTRTLPQGFIATESFAPDISAAIKATGATAIRAKANWTPAGGCGAYHDDKHSDDCRVVIREVVMDTPDATTKISTDIRSRDGESTRLIIQD